MESNIISSVFSSEAPDGKKAWFPHSLRLKECDDSDSSYVEDRASLSSMHPDNSHRNVEDGEGLKKCLAGLMVGMSILGIAGNSAAAGEGVPEQGQPVEEKVISGAQKKGDIEKKSASKNGEISWKYESDEAYRDFPEVIIARHKKVTVTSKKGKRTVTKSVREDISPYILKYSRKYGVNPYVTKAVIQLESSNNPGAVSPKGAYGLMQLLPSTARMMGVRDYRDPERNIEAGVKYLSGLLNDFGDLPTALAAYNAGPNNIYEGVNYAKKGYYRMFLKAYQSSLEEAS